MNLRKKFLIPVILVIILGLGASSLVSYHISKSAIESLINEELTSMVESLKRQLDLWLEVGNHTVLELSKEQYTRLSIRDTLMGKNARKVAHTFLSGKKQTTHAVDEFYIMNPDGMIVTSSNIIPDTPIPDISETVLYFNQAIRGNTVITDIFESPICESPVFLIMTPIRERDRIIGVFAGRFNFNEFCSDFLDEIKVGQTGHVIICNKKNIIVCHPDPDLLYTTSLHDFSISSSFEIGENSLVNLAFRGKQKRAAIGRSRQSGWTLVISIDKNEVNLPLMKVTAINSIIIVLSLCIALLIALSFSHFVTRPLRKAIQFATAVGQGHFSHELDISANDEIGLLSKSMKKMAKQLKRNMRALAVTNSELLKQRKAADAANQAKSDFLANMSHEIRTPMNAIIGLTALMQLSDLKDKQNDYVSKIDASAKSLLLIINEILDFSKIEANKLSLEKVTFYLHDLMNQLSSMFVITAAEENIEFSIDIKPDVPFSIIGDPLRLRQILINLVNNAIKFTPKGEVRITVELANTTETDCTLKFSVADTGIGMRKKEMAHLFEAFTQADTSVTRKFGGTGLGLSICKRLVEMMGGTISVESQAGLGSTFFFIVPFGLSNITIPTMEKTVEGDPDTVCRPIEPLKCKAVLERKRILLVEDNYINQQVALEILKSEGVEVDLANNGLEGVEAVKTNPYDLVLMDLQMPFMGGYEATRLIRDDERFKTLPIIAMTAHAISGTKEQCIDAGMNDYVSKPIDNTHLLEVLSKWLGHNGSNACVPGVHPFESRKNDGANQLCGSKSDPAFEPNIGIDQNELPGIDLTKAMERLNGNHVLFRRLLIDFAESSPAMMEQINRAVNCDDLETVAPLIHTIKGSAGNLSAEMIYDAAVSLEQALTRTNTIAADTGGGGNSDRLTQDGCVPMNQDIVDNSVAEYDKNEESKEIIHSRLAALACHLTSLVETIKSWKKEDGNVDGHRHGHDHGNADDNGTPDEMAETKQNLIPGNLSKEDLISMDPKIEIIRSLLKTLALSFARNDTSAFNRFSELRELLVSSPFQPILMEMEKHIDNFNFESALPLLEKIADSLDISLKE